MTAPDLSVIVVTHNGSALALKTLSSARAALGDITAEWFVVDAGSTDGTPAAIERRWSDVDVDRCENVGFAAANNRALARASGRYVLLLNPDVEIADGTFGALIAALDTRPDIGLASVVQRAPDGTLQYSMRRFPSPSLAFGEAIGAARWTPFARWREEQADAGGYGAPQPADWLVGAFLIARADAVREVGQLDERFFLYSEEIDWCYRFRRAGFGVWHLPVMTVIHHTGRGGDARLTAQLSYAKLLFARKHYGAPRTFAIRAALVARHGLRVIVGTMIVAARTRWKQRLSGERHALRLVLGLTQPPYADATTRRDTAPVLDRGALRCREN